MAHLLSRRSGPAALVSVLLAGIVIGCGGGGDNNNSGSTNATSGSNSGSNAGSTASNPGGTGGTDGGLGNLPQNSIFYASPSTTVSGAYDVRYVQEDGSGAGVYAAGVQNGISAAAPNPTVAGQFVFAGSASGNAPFGLYKGTVASTTNANTTQILAPSVAQITTLQVSRDGSKAIYVGTTSSSPSAVLNLYQISTSGGAPTLIDTDVNAAALSADGTKVVYSKYPDGDSATEIYIRFLSESVSTRLTNNDLFDDYPQFSKDGTKVVFSQQVSTSSRHELLATINLAAGAPYGITTFDPVPNSDFQRGPSFNSAGTRVSFDVVPNASAPEQGGIWTCNVDGSDPRQVVVAGNVLDTTYWSTSQGRSIAGQTLSLSFGNRRR